MSNASANGGPVADLEAARTIAELKRQLADKTAELERLQEHLRAHAVTDDLTDLANRKGFYILAEHSLRHAARRGLHCLAVRIDVVGLAAINERLGSERGDQLLVDVAVLLRETFRASDVVARTDGDEFWVLVQDPGDDATVIRRRIEDRVAAVNQRPARNYALALHLGIACTDPDNPGSLEELMNRAGQALYSEKHSRRPRSAA